MFIYLIVNHTTGKYYVGQHKGNNLRKYLQTKLSDAFKNRGGSSHLFASMRKHGREAFTIHALLSDIHTKPELDAYERDFITFLKSQDPEYGYNICRGGEGFTGPHTDETKRMCGEFGRLGGLKGGPAGGRAAVACGQVVRAGRIGGRKAVESGQLDGIRLAAKRGLIKWRKEHPKEVSSNVRKGGLVISCRRWNIERGKPCVCGTHLPKP